MDEAHNIENIAESCCSTSIEVETLKSAKIMTSDLDEAI